MKMKYPIHYTIFCFHLNSMLDRNFSIPINVVKEKIDDGSIFNWLQEKYGLDMDMSLHKDQELSITAILGQPKRRIWGQV